MILIPLLLLSNAHGQEYEKVWHWDHDVVPDVIVCEDSMVTIVSAKQAVSFWKEKGYRLGKVYKSESICKKTWHSGAIMFRGEAGLDTSEFNAFTTPWLDNKTGNMVSAVIQVSDDVAHVQELVNHELGHGLGLGHSYDYNDVMYEYRNY